MMRKLMWVGLVVAVAVVVAPAIGQQQKQRGQGRGGFGGGSLFLLAAKSVQEELKLSADQVKEVEDLNARQREAFQGQENLSREERAQKLQELGNKNQEAINKMLKPEQQKRLKQLSLQASGPMALAGNEEAAKELGLTDEQKEKLQTMRRESFGGFGQKGADRAEAAKKAAETRRANNEKAMDLLTAEQKTKWKELTGEPFKGELPTGFGGGFTRGKRNKQ